MLAACATVPEIGGTNYGNCRCCLSVGRHPRTFGKADLETLMDNLNLFLVADSRLPHLICSGCISSLEMIKMFRETVMLSETKLLQLLSEGITMEAQTRSFVTNKVGPSPHVDPLIFSQCDVKLEIDGDNQSLPTEDITSAGYMADNVGQSSQDVLESSDVKSEIEILENECKFTVKMESELIWQNYSDKESHKNLRIPEEPQENTIFSMSPLTKKLNDNVAKSEEKFCHVTPALAVQEKNINNNLRIPPVTYRNNLLCVEPLRASSSSHLLIGGVSQTATDNNKVRANIIQTLQNSTITPFRITVSSYIRCFYCEKTFDKFMDLREHMSCDHKEGANDYAIFILLQDRKLKIIHADISSLKCKLCDEQFENVDDLENHLSGIHQKLYYDVNVSDDHGHIMIIGFHLDNDPLTCHLCKQEFKSFKALTNHMSGHYGFFVCDECGKKFLNETRLRCHQQNIHAGILSQCKDCDKSFKSPSGLRIHIDKVHEKNKETKCPLCPIKFLRNSPMAKYEHMENVHGIKRPVFKCDKCDEVFKRKFELRSHKRKSHTTREPLVCDKCGYVTKERNVMERHIDSHNGVRKYECDLCQKKFRTKQSIRLHLRGHYNDKRFACSLCDAAFIQKHCLKSHIKSKHPDSGIDVSKM